ncbi:MAG TPA: hypothetical protein DCS87_04430 [Rheinheimera sp.]|nr:hypothetical protein [Rheinheimera sp.]
MLIHSANILFLPARTRSLYDLPSHGQFSKRLRDGVFAGHCTANVLIHHLLDPKTLIKRK